MSPGNYRPVSLLPNVSKVMERCLHNILMPFLEDNNRLAPNQSAFRKGSSTKYQLLELHDQLSRSLHKQMLTKVIICDISKAFDRVWHAGLLEKLKSKGIQGGLLKCFRDYLSN